MKRFSTIVFLLLISACTRTMAPVAVPSEDVPFPLARGRMIEATPAPDARTNIYLARGKRLFAVPRSVTSGGSLPEAALRALIDGPTAVEKKAGLKSRLPSTVQVLRLAIVDGVANVDLSGEFQAPARPDLVLMRVGQVVWTLGQFPEVDAIRFFADGEPVDVATDRDEVAQIVRRADYSSLAPA